MSTGSPPFPPPPACSSCALSRTNTPASDLTATSGGTTVTIAAATITDTAAPANDFVEVSGTSQRIFVRLTVEQ